LESLTKNIKTIQMKVNSKFFALCLMVLFSINLMTAQTSTDKSKCKNSGERSERQLEKMKAELGLTETQVSQLTAINTEYAAKMKAAKEAATDKEANRATCNNLRTEKTAAVKGILNTEQLAKFETIKSEHKGKRGKKGAHGKNAGTPEERAQKHTARLTEKLSLSEAQATRVAAINLEYAAKKKAAKDADTDREAFKNLRTEQHTAIKAVLTAEQVTAYEDMKGDRKGKKGKGRNRKG